MLSLFLIAAAAASPLPADPLAAIRPPCGAAYAGRLASTDAADADMAGKPLIMHVRVCDGAEVQIPFHVGEDRSRTWFLSAVDGGYRLKHRHRHADGSLDERTLYGGDSVGAATPLPGGGWRVEFPVDAHSKQMFAAQGIPQSMTNVWSVEYVPGRQWVYQLARPGRLFRVEFDLTAQVTPPPAPWGDEGAVNR
ncbi:hypothetical protein FJQ54_03845 [Sandaracinobacter neustonicus]|uniref:Secreted protein n=1 Tax=Sandaracinobacter neustonicus TaxID=1715348 RepID=A0A501XTK2_9SPHN|nr:hypothetical protein [Sandaracinobacter neustonicus]TPE63978.1 hypothetical protein FJQ54_03845 [Sandaracinobacter neustonicus]